MTWHSEASSPSALVCRVAQVLCQRLLPSLISLVLLLLLALLVSFPPEPASATGLWSLCRRSVQQRLLHVRRSLHIGLRGSRVLHSHHLHAVLDSRDHVRCQRREGKPRAASAIPEGSRRPTPVLSLVPPSSSRFPLRCSPVPAPSLSPLFFCFAVMSILSAASTAFFAHVCLARAESSLAPTRAAFGVGTVELSVSGLLHQASPASLPGLAPADSEELLELGLETATPSHMPKMSSLSSPVRCKAGIAISSSLLRTSVVFESASPNTFSGSVTASSSSSGTPVFLATQPAPTLKERTENEIRKETRERSANNEPTKTPSGAWIRQSPKMRSSSY